MTKSVKDNPGHVLRLFLTAATLALYLMAVLSPDREELFTGFARIMLSPAQLTKDYFLLGSVSGTFFNMALVGTVYVALMYLLPGVVVKGSTVAAFFLTVGFSAWGINFLNIWPFFLGVMLHALAKRESLSKYVDLAMFSTALCPLVSELLLRYPNDGEIHGITLGSALLALAVGILVGLLTPAIAAHSPSVHKGYDLYSAALPGGILGFFLVALLYKTAGKAVPAIEASLGESRPGVVLGFCGAFFALCVLAGFLLNGRSWKGYWELLRDTGHKVDFTAKYGPGLAILNVGVYGLFILAYYTAIGGSFNGVTLGIVFCMVCFGAAGSHPGNVWPIMVGYLLASLLGVNPINAQAIMVGLCFASGLAPIAGAYGWWAGVIAGGAHYVLVTSVPALHGGFCLYNGGFTALLIAIILVPQLETFCRTKAERQAAKAPAKK